MNDVPVFYAMLKRNKNWRSRNVAEGNPFAFSDERLLEILDSHLETKIIFVYIQDKKYITPLNELDILLPLLFGTK